MPDTKVYSRRGLLSFLLLSVDTPELSDYLYRAYSAESQELRAATKQFGRDALLM